MSPSANWSYPTAIRFGAGRVAELAGQCKALIHYEVTDDCIGCTRCAQQCPADAIAPTPYEKHRIDSARCVRCDGCRVVCPVGAIVVKSGGTVSRSSSAQPLG